MISSATEITAEDLAYEVSEDGLVRAVFSLVDRSVYVHADYDHRPADIAAMLLKLQEKGWVPVPEDEEEPEVLDTGVMIRFRKIYVPHNRKIIPALLSTPVLVGLGALAPTIIAELEQLVTLVGVIV